jgi:peptidoglycan/xylan/chitin deacetylase (PgdA/CDA1 family)
MMSRFAWSTIGVLIALGLVLTRVDTGLGQIRWLIGLSGCYVALLAAGSLSPHLNFYLRAIRRGPADRPWVALTFDDGPDPAITPALLELLRHEGISAAFFCVGEAARHHPDLVARAAADGHLIGNHSDRHGYGWAFSSARRVFAEFAVANQTLTGILGYAPQFVRTPAGVSRPDLAEALHQLRLINVAWDVRGLEMLYRDPDRIAARIARRARNGSIILLHETYYGVRHLEPQQVLATAQLTITRLRERGFRFVRLDQLLKQPTHTAFSSDQSWIADASVSTPENGTRQLTDYYRAANGCTSTDSA